MARHVFSLLLLVAVCLLQMSWGRPLTTEEAYRVLTVERQFLLEAADLLSRWRRSAAEHPQLVEEVRQLQARHLHLLAAVGTGLDLAGGSQPRGSQWTATVTELLGALWAERLPQVSNHTLRQGGEGREVPQSLSTPGGPGWTNNTPDEAAEAEPTAEEVDLLRQEAPSAEDLHRLADEFRRIWALHKRRFDNLDLDKDTSDQK